MALIRLGDYVELYSQKCGIANLPPEDVSGINRNREFFEPSKQVGNDTSNYKIVPPNHFACNLMHVGRDRVLPIALNKTNSNKIVSPAYTIFRLKNESRIISDFLFLLINSDEKDRYFWFHCDSSVRDGMDWSAFCDLEFDIPSIEIQRKYVAIYEGLLENLKVYESKLEDLKIMLEILFDKIKKDNLVKLSELLSMANKTNDNLTVGFDKLRGINENCEFISTRDSVTAEQINKYKIIKRGQYAINFMCLGNFGNFYLAYNDIEENVLVSPACTGMDLKKEIDPYYLMAYLTRSEFQRRCVFEGAGNTRGGINFDDFSSISVPVPSKQIRSSISSIYKLYVSRRKISDELKKVISNICPVLIRGAVLEENKE